MKNKEFKIHPLVKIDSFKKLNKIIGKRNPDSIRVTSKQYRQYHDLLNKYGVIKRSFPTPLFYQGARLLMPVKSFKGFEPLVVVKTYTSSPYTIKIY